jgi:hypothetical protein
MTRCQHCNKLTHSEHVNVYFKTCDFDTISEITSLTAWTAVYIYADQKTPPEEYGKLKCGDIILHFIQDIKEEI